MVVASCATYSQPHQTSCHDVHLVVPSVVRVAVEKPAEGKESQSSHTPRFFCRSNFVCGDLIGNKTIIRNILVEGPYHVVAIGVCVGPHSFRAESQHQVFGVRVTSYV